MSNQLITMVHDLRNAKDEKEGLETRVKELNKTIRRLAEQEIPEYMDENEIEKLTVEGVGTVYLTTKVYANVKAENKDAFYEWLRENGNAALIKETVYPATLNAFAKEQLGNGVALPDVIDARLYPTANLRRK